MAISSKLENIGNSCIDIRLAIKEQDNTLAAGSITTLGDDIRTIENRNYAYLLCRTQNGEMKTVKVHCKTNNTSPQFSSLIDDEIVACILPENITTLVRSAFQSTNVEYVNLENIVDFGAISLNKCQNLKLDTSSIVNAKWIAGSAFSTSAISGELYLPNLIGFCYSNQNPSTSSSEAYQFSKTNITKIMDLGSVPRITSNVFSTCPNLTEIHFPETCNLYGSSIFYLDTKLTKIYFKNLESLLKNVTYRYDTSHPFRYLADGTPTEVYVNDVLLTSVVIPNDATIINPYTFYNFTGLTSVTIPESVTVISDSVFRGCTGITSISIPESVTTIAQYAFCECTGLSGTLTIPSSVTSIGVSAFQNCSSLTNIVSSSSTATYGKSAFYGCTSVKDATFNGDITSNAWYNGAIGVTFGNMSGTLTINGSLTTIDGSAGSGFLHYNIKGNFNKNNSGGYGGLTRQHQKPISIRIGGNVTSVGGSIFYYSSESEKMEFLEVGGTISGTWLRTDGTGNCIMHLGYSGLAGTAANCAASATWIAKIYVGDGSSAAHDDAILQQYLADTDWAQYSSKLDTWYNYINSPDANPDYIN